MKKSEAISLHLKYWDRLAVFVWEENGDLVTEVDGKVFHATNMFCLDSKLSAAGIPAPRNLYFVDSPDYET